MIPDLGIPTSPSLILEEVEFACLVSDPKDLDHEVSVAVAAHFFYAGAQTLRALEGACSTVDQIPVTVGLTRILPDIDVGAPCGRLLCYF